MTEQDRKKSNKLHTFGRILRWIGLTVLSTLIILSLIFQAPWKLIALLLIVLVACTVLPKPYRKWFWLSVAGIVLILIIWVFLPEDDEGWRPYTFVEELAALQAKYAIPDSKNAATIYNQLFQDYNDASYFGNLPRELRRRLHISEPWTGAEHPVFMKWLNSRRDTITTLIEASKVEKCRFPIYADSIRSMKRINPIRNWSRLLTTAANNDLGEGRVDEALEKYMAVLRMAEHFCQQSTLSEMFVGKGCEGLALHGFRMFVITGDATEQRLDTIEQAVVDINNGWFFDRPGMLEYEKLTIKNKFGQYYEADYRGRLRLSRDPKAEIRARMKEMKDAFEKLPKDQKERMKKYYPIIWSNPNYWQSKLIRAKTILYWFYLPSRPQKGAEIIDALHQKYYKRAAAVDWTKEPEEISPEFRLNFTCLIEHLVVDSSAALIYRVHNIHRGIIAKNRGSRLIVALRRYKNEHGQWPQTLDSIKNLVPEEVFIDPISGGSFVYKLTEENFTLYSKGKNNVDEGGRPDRQSGADDWPIWSPKNRKTKDKKADTAQPDKQKDEVK